MKIFKIIAMIAGCGILIDVFFNVLEPGYKKYISALMSLSFFLMLLTRDKKSN